MSNPSLSKDEFVKLAMAAYDAESSYHDKLGLMTGANTSIYTDAFDGEYVVSGRISTTPEGSKTGILYKGKDRKKALWFANEVITNMRRNLATLEKEKKETFQYYD